MHERESISPGHAQARLRQDGQCLNRTQEQIVLQMHLKPEMTETL